MGGLDAGSCSAAAAAPRQGLAASFTRALNSALNGIDKWFTAQKARNSLA